VWITLLNYPDPILNTTATPALHQTLGFGFFKAFDHSRSTQFTQNYSSQERKE